MAAQDSTHSPHAFLLPAPLHGHVAPMLQLSLRLASHGFKISFAVTERIHSKISQSFSSTSILASNLKGPFPDLHLVTYPDGLEPVHGAQDISYLQILRALPDMEEPVDRLIQRINNQGPPITCFICDCFILSAQKLAHKYKVPRVAFWAANAASFSLYLHVPLLLSTGILPFKGEHGTEYVIDFVPGLPPLRHLDLPAAFLVPDLSSLRKMALVEQFEAISSAICVLVNSFDKLESTVLDAIRTAGVSVFPVGPLVPWNTPDGTNLKCTRASGFDISMSPESEVCLEWLDKQAPSSVLFVSFGTMAFLSTEQLQELAYGLENSQQPFLWVIRQGNNAGAITDDLPKDLAARIEKQGLIVPWAPQFRVLSHAAVGGFLSHCGWNSTIESMCAGVPILAWPQGNEQTTNCKLITEGWKCGMRLEMREDGGVGRREIERGVRALMEGEEGKQVRRVVGEVGDLARQAWMEGGSCDINVKAFVRSLENWSC